MPLRVLQWLQVRNSKFFTLKVAKRKPNRGWNGKLLVSRRFNTLMKSMSFGTTKKRGSFVFWTMDDHQFFGRPKMIRPMTATPMAGHIFSYQGGPPHDLGWEIHCYFDEQNPPRFRPSNKNVKCQIANIAKNLCQNQPSIISKYAINPYKSHQKPAISVGSSPFCPWFPQFGGPAWHHHLGGSAVWAWFAWRFRHDWWKFLKI